MRSHGQDWTPLVLPSAPSSAIRMSAIRPNPIFTNRRRLSLVMTANPTMYIWVRASTSGSAPVDRSVAGIRPRRRQTDFNNQLYLPHMQAISVEEVKSRIDAGEPLHLLDVREPAEHAEFNIGGTLLPLGRVRMMETDEIEPWKNEEVICYCRSGNRS